MAYQRGLTLGAVAGWNPPAGPSNYPNASGPVPDDDVGLLLRLIALQEMGSYVGGEPDWSAQIKAGTGTVAGFRNALVAWRTAHPEQDYRGQSTLSAWASAQLNGNALKQLSPGGSSASTSTTGGMPNLSPLAWIGIAASAFALFGRRRR